VGARASRGILAPLVLVLLLTSGLAAFGYFTYHTFTSHSRSASSANEAEQGNVTNGAPLSIDSGAHPTIAIDRNAGPLHIIGIPGATKILIEAKGTNYSDSPISYKRSGDGQTFTFDLGGAETLEVDLNVPATSDLNISTNGDDITVENVSGHLMLESNAGAMRATNVTLMGDSTLKSNAGAITFSGALVPGGTDLFDTNGGNVSVTLPASAAFHVDMTTNAGTIQTDFAEVTISGAEAHGNVGQPPYAQVTMSSNAGSLALLKG
jgi:hypothetical protein